MVSCYESGSNGNNVSGSVNVPLVKGSVALTAAVSRTKLPGWVDIPDLKLKDANGGTKTDARVAVRFTPSRALTVDASLVSGHIKVGENGATSPGVLDPANALPGAGGVPQKTTHDRETNLANLTIAYDLGAMSLLSATTFFDQKFHLFKDASYALPLFFGPGGAGGSSATDFDLPNKSLTQQILFMDIGLRGKEAVVTAAKCGVVAKVVDAANGVAVRGFVAEAAEPLGEMDVLVCNASGGPGTGGIRLAEPHFCGRVGADQVQLPGFMTRPGVG